MALYVGYRIENLLLFLGGTLRGSRRFAVSDPLPLPFTVHHCIQNNKVRVSGHPSIQMCLCFLQTWSRRP